MTDVTDETPAAGGPADRTATPSSGLLLGIEPLVAARKQHSPENDGTDRHGETYGECMADWLRHLPGRHLPSGPA